jgi:hypothetical protein
MLGREQRPARTRHRDEPGIAVRQNTIQKTLRPQYLLATDRRLGGPILIEFHLMPCGRVVELPKIYSVALRPPCLLFASIWREFRGCSTICTLRQRTVLLWILICVPVTSESNSTESNPHRWRLARCVTTA